MRTLASFIVAVELLLFLPLFVIYGQVDPCRALAKEIAWRAEAAGGVGVTLDRVFGDLEVSARRDIADHSTGECIGQLFSSWGERVTGK
jgi:hypothetical protein